MVPHDASYLNRTNGSTQPKKWAARALDKKCLLMTLPPERLVQIKNYFTELFLMMTSTEIAQKVSLGLKQGSPEL